MKGTVSLPSGASLDFSGPALVMAIVNCNSDSFFSPSRCGPGDAPELALRCEAEGAAIIDFGGESSRPGAAFIGVEEEIRRVIPAIESFRKQSSLAVSVDTRKAEVARAALDAGADIINDISALEDDPEMGSLCAERGAVVILMHKMGVPETMQDKPYYDNVVSDVRAYLIQAAARARNAGIPEERIILDPGFGFGKRAEDNLDLLAHLEELSGTVYPVLAGLSRKRFIGDICGRSAEDRLAGTLAANAIALSKGVQILRVHDVKETVDLVKIMFAVSARQGR